MSKSPREIFERKTENVKAMLMYPYIDWKLRGNHRLFFFFPFWQIGGGERVHADILKVFQIDRPLCFITDRSENDGFKKEFQASADTVVLGRWAEKRSFSKIMLKKIAAAINRQEHPVAFGCHSHFFYQLIPHLASHVKVVDLIHAFTFDPNGPEIYSLPHVGRLDHRVILGEKTKNDFKNLYQEKRIDLKYLERFTIIPNQSKSSPSAPIKDFGGKLQVLFVSRNAPEKRPELFVEIAKGCAQQNLPAEFIMVGDFTAWKGQVGANISIKGEIFDRKILDDIYLCAHLVLITSWREGFPLVMMEGMGHGVVPIATRVGEIPAYISSESHENGFLIENTGDTQAIVDGFVHQIEQLCQDRGLLQEFSHHAYRFAKEHFGEERFRRSYRKLLLGAEESSRGQ
jgi:glycosyltransferase involved in cell wall biosynthesis